MKDITGILHTKRLDNDHNDDDDDDDDDDEGNAYWRWERGSSSGRLRGSFKLPAVSSGPKGFQTPIHHTQPKLADPSLPPSLPKCPQKLILKKNSSPIHIPSKVAVITGDGRGAFVTAYNSIGDKIQRN